MTTQRALSIIPRLILFLAFSCAAQPSIQCWDPDALPYHKANLVSPGGVIESIVLRWGSDQNNFFKAQSTFHAPQGRPWPQTSQAVVEADLNLYHLPSIFGVSPSRSPPAYFAA